LKEIDGVALIFLRKDRTVFLERAGPSLDRSVLFPLQKNEIHQYEVLDLKRFLIGGIPCLRLNPFFKFKTKNDEPDF